MAARGALGDHEGAVADLSSALKLSPRSPLAHLHRGLLLARTRRRAEAREDLLGALADPGMLSPRERVQAKAALKGTETAGARGSTAARIDEAKRLQSEGRHDAAAEIYTALLKPMPPHDDVLRYRAEAYRCLGRNDLALADKQTIVELKPNDAEAVINRGDSRRRAHDLPGALADARSVLARRPRSAAAWVLRAECERGLGQGAKAVASATRAVECDARWGWALIVRAKALCQKGALAAALEDTHRAERAGEGAYAWGWRAVILRKLGRREEARGNLTRALAEQSTNAWMLALRGEVERELGRPERGLADLTEAVRLDPHCSCAYDFLGAEPRRCAPTRAWLGSTPGAAASAAKTSGWPKRPPTWSMPPGSTRAAFGSPPGAESSAWCRDAPPKASRTWSAP